MENDDLLWQPLQKGKAVRRRFYQLEWIISLKPAIFSGHYTNLTVANEPIGGSSGTLTQPGHKRAETGTGRRETPADSKQASEGVYKAVPEQRPDVRLFLLTGRATRCGIDNKKWPPGEDRSPQSKLTLHCVFPPRRPAPREGHCSAPARAAADGAMRRQPQGVPALNPGGVPLR